MFSLDVGVSKPLTEVAGEMTNGDVLVSVDEGGPPILIYMSGLTGDVLWRKGLQVSDYEKYGQDFPDFQKCFGGKRTYGGFFGPIWNCIAKGEDLFILMEYEDRNEGLCVLSYHVSEEGLNFRWISSIDNDRSKCKRFHTRWGSYPHTEVLEDKVVFFGGCITKEGDFDGSSSSVHVLDYQTGSLFSTSLVEVIQIDGEFDVEGEGDIDYSVDFITTSRNDEGIISLFLTETGMGNYMRSVETKSGTALAEKRPPIKKTKETFLLQITKDGSVSLMSEFEKIPDFASKNTAISRDGILHGEHHSLVMFSKNGVLQWEGDWPEEAMNPIRETNPIKGLSCFTLRNHLSCSEKSIETDKYIIPFIYSTATGFEATLMKLEVRDVNGYLRGLNFRPFRHLYPSRFGNFYYFSASYESMTGEMVILIARLDPNEEIEERNFLFSRMTKVSIVEKLLDKEKNEDIGIRIDDLGESFTGNHETRGNLQFADLEGRKDIPTMDDTNYNYSLLFEVIGFVVLFFSIVCVVVGIRYALVYVINKIKKRNRGSEGGINDDVVVDESSEESTAFSVNSSSSEITSTDYLSSSISSEIISVDVTDVSSDCESSSVTSDDDVV